MMRRGAVVLSTAAIAWATACGPGDPVTPWPMPDLADRVRFDLDATVPGDGGASDAAGPRELPGNVLPLDGGAAPLATLTVFVVDGETRAPLPARVIVRPTPGAGFADNLFVGTATPMSPGSLTGAVVSLGVLGSIEGVMLAYGQGVIPLPAGTYQLFVTRGPEYEAVPVSVTLAPGEARAVEVTLDRTVDTGGWLATDLHVHLGRSFDARLRAERRLISMVTNGVELVVATDHNVATDLAPDAAALGYGADVVGTIVGDEFNFYEGHGGAYPVPYDPSDAIGGGAPPWESCATSTTSINCIPTVEGLARARNLIPGTTAITINHPYWAGGDLGYFTNIGWGAGTSGGLRPLPTAGLFDAFELLSGYQLSSAPLGALIEDWFYLLNQRVRVTALGSSDTHRINWVQSGWPRTWLRLPTDRPGEVTGAMLAEAVKRGRAIASTGPFIRLRVDGADIGDTVAPRSAGKVSVDITVDAPGWIPVDTVVLYVNGAERRRFTVTPGQRPLFHAVVDETITADSFVVAQASGATALPPDVVGEYSRAMGYDMKPLAITNPVFVDANNDGRWEPSSAPLPPSRRPLWPADRNVAPAPAAADPCGAVDPAMLEPGLDALQTPLERELGLGQPPRAADGAISPLFAPVR
jgi:hypothetical protein